MGVIDRVIYDPFLLKTLTDRYNYFKSYTTNPEILSDAMLDVSDFDKQTIKFENKKNIRQNLVNRIIKANKNKIIYIDFWAEWCPPCIPELTISKKLIQNYKDQNIEFVFICLSDSAIAQKWIKDLNVGYRDNSLPTNGTVGRLAAPVTQTTTTTVPLAKM